MCIFRRTPFIRYRLCCVLFLLLLFVLVRCRKKDGSAWRPPSFDTRLASNITVLEGETAVLTCAVTRLRGRAVSWIRQRDLHVISADSLIFTTDNRFQVQVENVTSTWRLLVTPALRNDSGVYECQLNTRPKLSWPVTLNVEVPAARLEGPQELYIKSGSTLVLTCTATLHPDASASVWWRHNGSGLTITSPRGGVSIETEKEGRRIMSRLSLVHALASDAGNYTCGPDMITPSNVTVYVVEEEVPAAMAHDGASSTALGSSVQVILCLTLLTCTAFTASVSWVDPLMTICKELTRGVCTVTILAILPLCVLIKGATKESHGWTIKTSSNHRVEYSERSEGVMHKPGKIIASKYKQQLHPLRKVLLEFVKEIITRKLKDFYLKYCKWKRVYDNLFRVKGTSKYSILQRNTFFTDTVHSSKSSINFENMR